MPDATWNGTALLGCANIGLINLFTGFDFTVVTAAHF